MIENQEIENYGSVIQEIYPAATLMHAWPLSGGISASMTALEFKSAEGAKERIILRQYPPDPRHHPSTELANENQILHLVQELEIPSPKPLFLELSNAPLGSPYLLMEYVEGEMDFTPTNLKNYLQQMAMQMARLHSADIRGFDLSYLPNISKACSELDRERTAEPGVPFNPAAIRRELVNNWPLAQKNENRLLHGDYWPGNVLWRDGSLAAIIDWADAKVGDPLIDLARTRSEIAWIFGINALQQFTDIYRSHNQLNDENLPYWDLCAALRQLRFAGHGFDGTAEFFKPYGRTDITGESIKENLAIFINQAWQRIRR